ncbi:hypothetical protein [Noviluteimonas gilva]|uniref:Uncharacterized protein n=1 Tax=Noviluteimonas gilva TaxID=2682097 RepID=A0A7C9M2Q9_9GAMM|nr:hypothetical protein [Lysobacter gilvus]MUV13542.1 hypothetical protein [Lysobacter gilvus]
MNTAHLSGAECSDHGKHEDPRYDIPALVWASLIATALLWCLWQVVRP